MRFRLHLVVLMLGSMAGLRADPGFLLGVDYSEWLPPQVTQLGVDGASAIYALSSAPQTTTSAPPSIITKLSADGTAVVWTEALPFPASTMAVAPDGSIFVTNLNVTGNNTAIIDVVKLKSDGSGVEWTRPGLFTQPVSTRSVLTVDTAGRVYAGGYTSPATGSVVRLTPDGNIDYTTTVPEQPTSIAVGSSGDVFIAGGTLTASFLTHLLPNGAASFTVPLPEPSTAPNVAIDSNGHAVVYTGTIITRFDSAGGVASSKVVASFASFATLALDSAGNAYIMGTANAGGPSLGRSYPVRNSLATCGLDLISVIAPDGTLLQTTYIPHGLHAGKVLLTLDPRGGVLVVDSPDINFVPTRTGPISQNAQASFLLRLAQDAKAVTYPLACYGNGANFSIGRISPGEVIVLYGEELGPQTGVAPSAPYPPSAASVQVTFDGKPAPLLWVQDQQINTIVPWSLTPGDPTKVCVTNGSLKTNCLMLDTFPIAPAVFIQDGNYAVALNQDGSVNSAANPAAPNSYVSVFATGLGEMSPTPVDGALAGFPLATQVHKIEASVLVATGLIGTIPLPVEVQYAGAAPFRPLGISQINFRVSASGPLYQLILDGQFQSPLFNIHIAGH